MIASACRSASKRATTWRVSMPGLRTLRATFRRTGSICSAMKTTPKPPSPICSRSLYGPMTVPACSDAGPAKPEVAASGGTAAGARRSKRLCGVSCAASISPTRRHNSASCPQFFSSQAGRSAGGTATTARNSSFSDGGSDGIVDPYSIRHLICERRGGFVSNFFRVVGQGGGKPCPGEGPFPVGGGSGETKDRGRFLNRKAVKDSGFDNLRGQWFGAGQALQGLVQFQETLVVGLGHRFDLCECN